MPDDTTLHHPHLLAMVALSALSCASNELVLLFWSGDTFFSITTSHPSSVIVLAFSSLFISSRFFLSTHSTMPKFCRSWNVAGLGRRTVLTLTLVPMSPWSPCHPGPHVTLVPMSPWSPCHPGPHVTLVPMSPWSPCYLGPHDTSHDTSHDPLRHDTQAPA